MSYQRRIQLAVAVSLALHLIVLAAYALMPRPVGVDVATRSKPFVVDLRPEEKNPVRELVDVSEPATEPVQPTNKIAEVASNARDVELREAEELGPNFEQEARHDFLAPPVAPPAPVEPPQEQAPVMPQEVKEEKKAEKKETAKKEPEKAREAKKPVETETAKPEATEEAPKRVQVAKAIPPPEEPQQRESRGRKGRGVTQKGMGSFEALQDDLAPYLKHIRDRVERRWFDLLLTSYSGTKPTYAEVDVSINADGTLEDVRLVVGGDDRIFGAICEQAIKRAGPFNPFPFEVPDIYRDKNLQLRYTFSFL